MKYHLLWEGPSVLDGAPIALVAGVGSKNSKTGDMVQVYIIRNDMHPQDAIESGADESICGSCRFRGKNGKGRTCYVVLMHGTYQVWDAKKKGQWIPTPNRRRFGKGKKIRCGAYGDPAMVPFEIWQELLEFSAGHTGYTHQWRTCDHRFSSIIMASCDHAGDYHDAKALGWKTYRAKLPGEHRMPGERPCPANPETGVTCADCLGCNGQRRDFTIDVHGTVANINRYREFRMTLETP